MKIEVLFPELCNLYGDMGNVDYLKACTNAEILYTSILETPRFPEGDVSLVYLGSMTERSQERILKKLAEYKDCIADLAKEKKTLFLLTGNALELFCGKIHTDGGEDLQGLGLIPCDTHRIYPKRVNSLFCGKMGEMTVVGYTSRFSHLKGLQKENALFRAERGLGAEPGCTYEGVRLPGILGSYLLGPLLPMNPPFTEFLLKEIGVAEPRLAFKEAAMEAYQIRCEQYANPKVEL